MKLFIFLCLIFFVFGCSNPMNEKLTKDNYQQVIEKIKKDRSQEEFDQTIAVVSLYKLSTLFSGVDVGTLLEGKSFNEHIAKVKENLEQKSENDKKEKILKEQEDIKKAQEDKEKELKSEQFGKMIEFSNYKKGEWETEYGIRKYVEFKMKIKNISEYDIDAFDGWLIVYDKFDKQLAKFYLKETKTLKKGESRKIETSREINPYSDDNVAEVKITDLEDLKIKISIDELLIKK